ncbi:hypothetical protein CU098_007484 [Rhizopus stolonifer]|uniref:Uncharacterized protein n=1 Tax=Rhizopus stolonifer TaxID=4846 RepID=A0A367ISX3_RHIST|nr:hypothetical protein CU098_007484 [Rhizopus stolonifer]
MLSGSRRFQKKNKVSPQDVSLNDLATLVKRLSVQVDDLVEEQQQQQQQQQQQKKSLEAPLFHFPPITVDPWASHVPQNYGALLQRLEDMDTQPCPNACCSSVSLSTAEGVPWPAPLEPFRSMPSDPHDLLDQQYTHWCTLMRCLPLMDPVTSVHVKTVGLYAMREILKMKAQKQQTSSKITLRNSMSWGISETLPIACMNLPPPSSPSPLPPKEATTPTPCISPQKNRFQKWIKQKTLNKSWLL